MQVTADITVVPLGVGDSLSPYVAACEDLLAEAGTHTLIHAHGTNVDGELDAILNAVKDCQTKMHEMGAPRVETQIRIFSSQDGAAGIDTRIGSVVETMSRSSSQA